MLRKNLRSSECALVAVQVDGVFCLVRTNFF